MITGSILYLLMRGQDMGIVAEQLLNGMYTNYIMLAVPLFILAAEIMNSGSLSERLLNWCNAVVGRFRGGLAQVNILQSIVFAGMSGSAIADAAGSGKMMQFMMTKDGKYTPSYAAALTAATAVIGPIIPPSIPMVLYALVADTSIGYLFLGGVVPGLLMAGVMMVQVADHRAHQEFPGRGAGAAAQAAAHDLGGAAGAADAGGADVRHLWRRHHADRSRRGRRLLCAGRLGGHLSRRQAGATSTARC